MMIGFLEHIAIIVGKLSMLLDNKEIIELILLLLAGCVCIFGFYLSNYFSAIVMYLCIIALFCRIIPDNVGWGRQVTYFIVCGTIMAFICVKCKKFSSYFLCSMIGISIGLMIMNHFICGMFGGVLFLCFTFLEPRILICLSTSLWGVLVLIDGLHINEFGWVGILCWFGCFALQMKSTQKQTLFKEKPKRTSKLIKNILGGMTLGRGISKRD